jgi:hypothetical protein
VCAYQTSIIPAIPHSVPPFLLLEMALFVSLQPRWWAAAEPDLLLAAAAAATV